MGTWTPGDLTRLLLGLAATLLAPTGGCLMGCQAAGAGRTVGQGVGPSIGDVGPGSTVRIIELNLTPGQAVGLLGAGGAGGAGLTLFVSWLASLFGKKAASQTPTPEGPAIAASTAQPTSR